VLRIDPREHRQDRARNPKFMLSIVVDVEQNRRAARGGPAPSRSRCGSRNRELPRLGRRAAGRRTRHDARRAPPAANAPSTFYLTALTRA